MQCTIQLSNRTSQRFSCVGNNCSIIPHTVTVFNVPTNIGWHYRASRRSKPNRWMTWYNWLQYDVMSNGPLSIKIISIKILDLNESCDIHAVVTLACTKCTKLFTLMWLQPSSNACFSLHTSVSCIFLHPSFINKSNTNTCQRRVIQPSSSTICGLDSMVNRHMQVGWISDMYLFRCIYNTLIHSRHEEAGERFSATGCIFGSPISFSPWRIRKDIQKA